MPNFYFDTGIEINDFDLVKGGPETDFQNAKIVYEALKDKINPVQASDLRLWAYLSFVQFWAYMSVRWNISSNDEEELDENELQEVTNKQVRRIKSRYFFGSSRGKAYVRQGIARLYWSVYLTYDETNKDPYEYTEFFFSKQDIFISITERSYARNKTLVLAALKTLKNNPGLSREEIRLFWAKLNQAGAVTVLDFLNTNQANQLCESLMDEVNHIPVIQEGSQFKVYHNITGKIYGSTMKIVNGKATMLGKQLNVKPQNLIGKRKGTKITISGQKYIIKNIE